MKIKIKNASAKDILLLAPEKRLIPKKPNILFRTLLKIVSLPDLLATKHKLIKKDMHRLKKNEPCLFLMNHSSFLDLKIATSILYPRPLNIVCTHDGLVGKRWLMKNLGCFPTRKFVNDVPLLKDIKHCLTKLKSSVLMFPEAGYSFDGTATKLPESIAKLIKYLSVPIVMITTFGAFHRDPLYNNLQLRKVKVTTEMKYLLSPEDIKNKQPHEINEIIKDCFKFDNFKWQQDNEVKVTENFRADYLHRVLYKCPHCLDENNMIGKGEYLTCNACGKKYRLTETGYLEEVNGDTKFNHIPTWYAWEREQVKKEISEGVYNLNAEVDVYILKDTKCLYKVGEGTLNHSANGFHLNACNNEIDFKLPPLSTYTINADYNWYEIGDVISIGNNEISYYCFPKDKSISVTKARLATEELYEIAKSKLKN